MLIMTRESAQGKASWEATADFYGLSTLWRCKKKRSCVKLYNCHMRAKELTACCPHKVLWLLLIFCASYGCELCNIITRMNKLWQVLNPSRLRGQLRVPAEQVLQAQQLTNKLSLLTIPKYCLVGTALDSSTGKMLAQLREQVESERVWVRFWMSECDDTLETVEHSTAAQWSKWKELVQTIPGIINYNKYKIKEQ